MKTINTHIEEVLKEFGKLFLPNVRDGGHYMLCPKDGCECDNVDFPFLKNFLKQSLLTLHTQTLGQIREEVKKKISASATSDPVAGYNQAIQDVLDLLDNQTK